jgi:Holliday junction resolvase RusA-like endonuclease
MEISEENGRRTIKIVVPGEPVPQGRPRFRMMGNHPSAYDPPKSRLYKLKIKEQVSTPKSNKNSLEMILGIFSIAVYVYRQVPKSWNKKKRQLALDGTIRPTTRPDTDNYIKGALDALNGVVYADDSAAVDIIGQKFYSDNPRMEIVIVEKKGDGDDD